MLKGLSKEIYMFMCVCVCIYMFMSFHYKGLFLSRIASETCIHIQDNDVTLWTWDNMLLPISLILFYLQRRNSGSFKIEIKKYLEYDIAE